MEENENIGGDYLSHYYLQWNVEDRRESYEDRRENYKDRRESYKDRRESYW